MARVRIDFITETGKRELKAIKKFFKMVEEMFEARCKYCGSSHVVKNGKSRKGIQNWLCRNCGKGFVNSKALPRMKSPISHVSSAVYLYYTGSSLNEIRRHIEQQHGILPSDATIYNWVTRFSKIAINEAQKHIPNVGDTWVADETVLDIGGKKWWLWDIIDYDTRYLLASHLSQSRTTKDAQKLMELASAKAKKTPKVVITDKLASYLDGIELAFGADTKHIPSKPFIDKDSTNIIERFQGTLKDRTKVMRGFKKPESARLMLDGWLVYYNFFRPHEGLKDKTPAQVAKIKFPYQNWLDVVRSQSPTAHILEGKQDKPVVISTDYSEHRGIRHIRRRHISKRQLVRTTKPATSILQGRRFT